MLLLGLLPVVPGFYHFIQARPGRLLADPLLDLLPVRDVSVLTFTLIYGAIVATLVYLLPRPQLLLRALWAYYFLQVLRMATLWLLPLEPPTTLLMLHDPVMDHIFAVTTQPIVRDLFFSGHTATMALLPVHDVSVPTFTLIYGAIVATLVYLLPRPQLLLRALWAYYFLQVLRMATLWLLPLEPPTTLLMLHDPVMDHLFAVTTQPIVRDLFFSGHTATMALLMLAGRGRRWRWALGLLTVAVGLLVLVQRVHYSYDVLAAPFFAWGAYWLAGRVTKQ